MNTEEIEKLAKVINALKNSRDLLNACDSCGSVKAADKQIDIAITELGSEIKRDISICA